MTRVLEKFSSFVKTVMLKSNKNTAIKKLKKGKHMLSGIIKKTIVFLIKSVFYLFRVMRFRVR